MQEDRLESVKTNQLILVVGFQNQENDPGDAVFSGNPAADIGGIETGGAAAGPAPFSPYGAGSIRKACFSRASRNRGENARLSLDNALRLAGAISLESGRNASFGPRLLETDRTPDR